MTLVWHWGYGLLAARPIPSVRGTAALVLMIALVTGGLLLVNVLKRFIQRTSDSARRPPPFTPPPVDDWARKPLASMTDSAEVSATSPDDGDSALEP